MNTPPVARLPSAVSDLPMQILPIGRKIWHGNLLFFRALVCTSFHSRHDKKVAYFILLPLGNRNEKKKTPPRISIGAVGIALEEIRREASALCASSAKYRLPWTSYIPIDDCFAALLKSSSSLRRSVGGFLPALSFQLSILFLPFTSSSRFEIGF